MLDRKLQEKLLIELAERYPSIMRHDFVKEFDENIEKVFYNLYYLFEHDLISMDAVHVESGRLRFTDRIIITAKGIDFIQNDGGLSAIFGTVTVKLHADTIRDLIEAKILSNEEIPPEEKSSMLKSLRAMPEEAMRQLTQKLIGYGLEQAPSAWGAIIQSLTQ